MQWKHSWGSQIEGEICIHMADQNLARDWLSFWGTCKYLFQGDVGLRLVNKDLWVVPSPWPKWSWSLHRHSQHQGKQIQWRPSWLQKQFMPPWSRWLNRSLTFDEMWQKPWGMTVLGQEKLRDQFLIINWTDRLYECPRVRSCVKLSFLSRYSRLGFEKTHPW